jgi:GTP cyclohydrolase I
MRHPESGGLSKSARMANLEKMGTATRDPEAAPVRALHDKQSEADHRRIPINRVGVKGVRHPVRVRDKEHDTQETVAQIDMSVDLPHHFKGTHMSRFLEALNAHGREIHVRNIPEILEGLRRRLAADCAHLTMEFPYFLEKRAPVSGAPGLMDYAVRFEATSEGGKMDFVCTVVVPVTTLCPCSKDISARGAHNQRGYVTLSVRFGKRPVWIEDLVRIVEDSASCGVFSLLKRPDEKYVTERAFDNPVFVEDLVRNVAVRLNRHPDIAWYRVEAENLESIHNHSAFAIVERG